MFETFGMRHLLPLLSGLRITILVSLLAELLGTIWGGVICAARMSPFKILRKIAQLYISLIRGIPLLILLFTVYYTLPIVFKSFYINKEVACIVSLVLYAGAYISEIMRGAIQSIPKEQTQASMAIGMNYFQRMGYVILPQAICLMTPPFVGFFIALVKDSALISIINFVELTRAGKIIGNLTMNPLLTYAFVALFYFIVCFTLSRLAAYSEKKLNFVFM